MFNWQSVLIPAYGGKLDNQTEDHVYVNPAYMTVIVAGSAGSKERISSGSAPKKDLAKYIEDYGLVQSHFCLEIGGRGWRGEIRGWRKYGSKEAFFLFCL